MSQAAGPPQNFPTSLIDQIAETIGATTSAKRRRLAHFLRQMPANLALYRTRDSVPQPARIRDRLERIEAACTKVIEEGSDRAKSRVESLIERAEPETLRLLLWQYALRANRKHPEAAIADGSADLNMRAAPRNYATLRAVAWAARIRVSQAAKGGQGGDRHVEDTPLDWVMLQLEMLYFEVTRKKPGISSDATSGRPSGQYLSFLGLCLDELGYSLKPDALRSRFRRLRKRYPNESVIAGPNDIS